MNIKTFSYSKVQLALIIIFTVLVILFFSILSYKVVNFIKVVPVEEVVIVGASPEIKKEIMDNISFLKGEKVLTVNLENLKQYIDSFPWIYKSSVSRKLSGKIIITVIERNPYFLWLNDEEDYKLITSDDTLTKVNLSFPLENLITIEKGSLALKNSHKLRFLIYKNFNVLKQIKTLRYNGYRWDIILKSGLVIKLPETDIEKAYTKFLALNNKYNFLDKNLQYVDVTSVNKLFILQK